MAVRATMQTNLIPRVRQLINDPSGASQVFADQDVQDTLDESRQDVYSLQLTGKPTWNSTGYAYLDYETELGGWEDGMILKQFFTIVVTPSVSEPIVGHWQFAANTLPPVHITGKLYDVYRAAADLLERLAAKWMLSYSFSSDGQSFQRGQASIHLEKRIQALRRHQRAGTISLVRTDTNASGQGASLTGPQPIDYIASGNPGGG